VNRLASAPAITLAPGLDVNHSPGNDTDGTDLVRLLGVGSKGKAGTSSYLLATRRHEVVLPPAVDLPDGYAPSSEGSEEVEEARANRRPVMSLPSLSAKSMGLAALAVGLALVAAVVTPAMASGKIGGQEFRLKMSGYRELNSVVVPIIDATSGSVPVQEAAPPQEGEAPQPPAQPSGSYNLAASPSTSVGQIESVLRKYGSPAVGKGPMLFDLGVKYGIDPAYALAFFVHESACGTRGVARFTNSLGNIRWTEGWENYEGYRKYASWEQGIEDWYKLITELYIGEWGLRTVDDIIPVYAPAADRNHPPSYIASVKFLVDSWRGK
jgi:Mannosyl-glycoprotein endo-beta-N-acetylglucosaminidase